MLLLYIDIRIITFQVLGEQADGYNHTGLNQWVHWKSYRILIVSGWKKYYKAQTNQIVI